MDGSETGWGRAAEPAPRWRALLDRARHASRSDPAEPGWAGEEAPSFTPAPAPAPLPERLPRRSSGGGYAGRASIGRSAEPHHGPERTYPVESPAHAAERAYPVELPAHAAEPVRYPTEPAGYRSDPSPYPAEPAGYPAEQPPRPRDAGPVESRYALLENDYRPAPAHPAESRYALLENGYRADPGYQSPPVTPPRPVAPPAPVARRQLAPPPPVVPPRPAPPAPAGGYPAQARLEWRRPAPETELERAAGLLRRELGTPRVLAFANPKGGVHKTTATVLAAATIGSIRGRGVLAWDDNELRGTLGLRAGSARHARTIRHLIADLAHIEIQHGSVLTERLDDYLRHASDGSYDVLAGEESPRFAQRLDQFTVRRVLELLRRTHDVICVDTGNNVESPNWRTVMQAADQLVLTTVPREDAAFSADWMLDLLHEVGMGELADNAVTLLSCPTPGRSPLLDDLHRHFATRTRAVAVVPYDPALETGSSIEYHQLQPDTRHAWLRAASVMLEPFAR